MKKFFTTLLSIVTFVFVVYLNVQPAYTDLEYMHAPNNTTNINNDVQETISNEHFLIVERESFLTIANKQSLNFCNIVDIENSHLLKNVSAINNELLNQDLSVEPEPEVESETEVAVETENTTEPKKETEIEVKPKTEPESIPPKENEAVSTDSNRSDEPKKPTVSNIEFVNVDEKVYANKRVNIRVGPSVDYEKIGMLQCGDSVVRIGIGSNGWSKVIYNGKKAYISSKYLQRNNPCEESVKQDVEKEPLKKPEDSSSAESKVTFERVDEYLYVTTTFLRVRTGPGTEFANIASIAQNGLVHRIGIGDNGWSKIIFNDKEAYVYSTYLSTQKVEDSFNENATKPVSEQMKDREGMIGRLTIPDVGVNVALFQAIVIKSCQGIVDDVDSAAYIDCVNYGWKQDVIADHKYQGFDSIKQSTPHKTIAYIDYGAHIKKYMCVDKFVGENIVSEILDNNGEAIRNKNEGGLTMYTCNQTANSVTVTYWQPI